MHLSRLNYLPSLCLCRLRSHIILSFTRVYLSQLVYLWSLCLCRLRSHNEFYPCAFEPVGLSSILVSLQSKVTHRVSPHVHLNRLVSLWSLCLCRLKSQDEFYPCVFSNSYDCKLFRKFLKNGGDIDDKSQTIWLPFTSLLLLHPKSNKNTSKISITFIHHIFPI